MMQPRHFALKCKEEPSQKYFEFVVIYFDCLNSSLTQSPPRKQITWTKIGDLKEAILFVLNAQSTEYKNGCQAANEEETQNMVLHEVPYFINCHTEKKGKGKGKFLPRTGHEGPEGKQMYSSTLPSSSALDVGGWSTKRPGCFTPGNDPVPVV